MKISELEALLARLREAHGDINVVWESLERRWSPDPAVRNTAAGEKIVVLNS